MNSEPLDVLPLWAFFLLAAVLIALAVEGGYRLGSWRHARKSPEKDGPVAAVAASVLGLLAFMLAFTFSMAAGRFDARRQVVLQEANAIGTTYLRTRFLPEPERSETAKLLRDYTALRVNAVAEGDVGMLMARSEALHGQLWSQTEAAAGKDPHSIMTGLFVQSLNETIDLHAKRVFLGLRSRIPLIIWMALFSLTVLGMASIGYQAGLSATRRLPSMPLLAVAFAVVLCLIADLDRGQEGLLRVSQQAMIDLLGTMQAGSPEARP